MGYKVLYEAATGKIESAGYCDFTPGTGQAVIEVAGEIPADLARFYHIVAGILTAMTQAEKDAVLAGENELRKDISRVDKLILCGFLVICDRFGVTKEQFVTAVKNKYNELFGG